MILLTVKAGQWALSLKSVLKVYKGRATALKCTRFFTICLFTGAYIFIYVFMHRLQLYIHTQ